MSTLLARIFSRQFTITLVILYLIIGLSTSQITISSSWAEPAIPSWIKNNAGWWADGMITEDEFLKGIEYLINNNIILIYDTTIDEKAFTPTDTSATKRVPDWVKNNAGWWAEDLIKDYDFLNGCTCVSSEATTTKMWSHLDVMLQHHDAECPSAYHHVMTTRENALGSLE